MNIIFSEMRWKNAIDGDVLLVNEDGVSWLVHLSVAKRIVEKYKGYSYYER